MIKYVFRPKRKCHGKSVPARLFSGRLRLDGWPRLRTFPLHVMDKRVAEEKLNKLAIEYEREQAGLLPSRSLRQAAEVPLATHLESFLKDRQTRGCVEKHVQNVAGRVRTLLAECGWKHGRDVNATAFLKWREGKKMGAGTMNNYLKSARSFFRWLEDMELIEKNPLKRVELVRVEGRTRMVRRSFTSEELGRLFAVAGPRAVIYRAAALTGARRGELGRVRWADVVLDGPVRQVIIQAWSAKNHQQRIVPLRADFGGRTAKTAARHMAAGGFGVCARDAQHEGVLRGSASRRHRA